MRQPIASKNGGETPENGKAPSIVAQKIREGIPEEVFLPGEHLKEIELAVTGRPLPSWDQA